MAENERFDEAVSRWLEETAPARIPERVLNATFERTRRSRQYLGWNAIARRVQVSRMVPVLTGAAVILLSAAVGLAFFANLPGVASPPTPSPTTSSTVASPSHLPTAGSSLPILEMPGARAGPPGQYGWQGGPGQSAGMHHVVESEDRPREATAMGFAVAGRHACLDTNGNPAPEPVEIGTLQGISIEPYEPAYLFNSEGDATTRAFALEVGNTTLCVFLTWHATTTAEEVASAEATIRSLRAEPYGKGGVRIVFELFDGWDTG